MNIQIAIWDKQWYLAAKRGPLALSRTYFRTKQGLELSFLIQSNNLAEVNKIVEFKILARYPMAAGFN